MSDTSTGILVYDNATLHASELRKKVTKEFEYSFVQKTSTTYTFQKLLKLQSGRTYHIICTKKNNDNETFFELYLNTSIVYHTYYGLNNYGSELYIYTPNTYDYYIVTPTSSHEGANNNRYKLRLVNDNLYTKWHSGISVVEDDEQLCNGKPSDITDLLTEAFSESTIDESSATTQKVVTSNGGASITAGPYMDYIIDNQNDDEDELLIDIDGRGEDELEVGIYRFTVTKNATSITLSDGSLSTTYDANILVPNSILTYSKTSDTEAAFTYQYPKYYSSDGTVTIKTDANGRIDMTTTIANITKCLAINKDNIKTYNTSWHALTIPEGVVSIYIDPNIQEVTDLYMTDCLIQQVMPQEGYDFKDGQRLTISGQFRLGDTSMDYAVAPYYYTYMRNSGNAFDYMSQYHAVWASETFIYWKNQWYSRGYIDAKDQGDGGTYWQTPTTKATTLSITGQNSPINSEGTYQYNVVVEPSDAQTNIVWSLTLDDTYTQRSVTEPSLNLNGVLTVPNLVQQYATITATDTISGISDSKTLYIDTLNGSSTWVISGKTYVTAPGEQTYTFGGTYTPPLEASLVWSCSDETIVLTPSADTLSCVMTIPDNYSGRITLSMSDILYKDVQTATMGVHIETTHITSLTFSEDLPTTINAQTSAYYTATTSPEEAVYYNLTYTMDDAETLASQGVTYSTSGYLQVSSECSLKSTTITLHVNDSVSGLSDSKQVTINIETS